MSFKEYLLRLYFSRRAQALRRMTEQPLQVQAEQLHHVLAAGHGSEFCRRYYLTTATSYEQFRRDVPIAAYDDFYEYIGRMLRGDKDVTVRGRVDAFARSSGTSTGRSKYIPITRQSMCRTHMRGMRDVAALWLASNRSTKVLAGKVLTLGGSCRKEHGALVGDLSAVVMQSAPRISSAFRTPQLRTALIDDFDRKVERICRECVGQRVTALAGVPSWITEMLRRIKDYTGAATIGEVWPDLELFVHGGVSFAPYRRSLDEIIGKPIHYLETYNASEGFFAIADSASGAGADTENGGSDMLLMLDYYTFYEFRSGNTVVPLEGVRTGATYALIISSVNGLWRYELGDTVEFTSTSPYRIRFVGRTTDSLNAFGEELSLCNVEQAMASACEREHARVAEYTVTARYMTTFARGAHEWIVEFDREPQSVEQFARVLDEELRLLNSDYDAKRQSSVECLRIRQVGRGTFARWLQQHRRNKIPRLSASPSVAEQLWREWLHSPQYEQSERVTDTEQIETT